MTRALSALAITVLVTCTACQSPGVVLVLRPADGLAGPPDFVRFVFESAEGDEHEVGPFAFANIPAEDFAGIPPGVSFAVDVIGCLTNDPAECVDPGSFVVRGCRGGLSRTRDQVLEVEIEILPAVEGNAVCPASP
jgi:hypothetical protein